MAFITGLNRPQGNERRSIAVLLQNFDLVTEQVNGNLDDSNIAATAGIKGSKLSIDAVVGQLVMNSDHSLTDGGGPNDINFTNAPLELGADFWAAGTPNRFKFDQGGLYFITANLVITSSSPPPYLGRRQANIRVAPFEGAASTIVCVDEDNAANTPCYFVLSAIV